VNLYIRLHVSPKKAEMDGNCLEWGKANFGFGARQQKLEIMEPLKLG
jgi:hypothetical protein